MTRETDEPQVIPLSQETIRIDKADVVTGRVQVRTVTEETEEIVGQDLESETVEITRVPVDREVDEAPAMRQEGDVTILSVVEEVIVVTKRLVVKEEVHIRRVRSTEHVETSVNLRKQHAVVERSGAGKDSLAETSLGERS